MKFTDIVTIELCAHGDLEDLLEDNTPPGVWLRRSGDFHGIPEITIMGPLGEVQQFVTDNWGEDCFETPGEFIDACTLVEAR